MELVKADTIKDTEARKIGTEWICANTGNNLKLTELFEGLGWQIENIQLATKMNLETLTQRGYKYVVLSRVKIKGYRPVKQGKETYFLTKPKKIIRLQAVQMKKYTDSFSKVESEAKGLIEQGITNRLGQGYEKQLHLIKQSLTKPRGVKKLDKVHQRLGKAKQKYPYVHRLYNIHLDVDSSMQIVKDLHSHKELEKSEKKRRWLGVYFLRTGFRRYGLSIGMDDLQ